MYTILAIFLGAVVGSFLNVCIFRIPKEESIVFPGSHCQSCQKKIAPLDNIPLLSFLILRGRCRYCAAKISWQYPLVEFLSAGLFVLFYYYFGLTVKGALYLLLALALLTETFIDLRHRIIPDVITLPGVVIGLAASVFFPGLHDQRFWWGGLSCSLIGMFAGGGFFYMTGMLAERVLKKEAIGGGDIKLMAMIGAFLGWQGAALTIFSSSVIGSVVGVYLKIKNGEERIPFGPFIALGAFFYLFYGHTIIQWYVQSMGIYGY